MSEINKWMVYSKKADFNALGKTFGIDPVTARIMVNRDIKDEGAMRKYINADLKDCYDPFLMKGMSEAVAIIKEKISQGRKIRIIGDYDIDGVCATTILVKAISSLGGTVDYDIPERIKDGYGINKRLIDEAVKDGIDTIITCDNGISAKEEVKYAKDHGLTVIVTDHHEIPFENSVNVGDKTGSPHILRAGGEETGKRYILPEGDVVMDPHMKDCKYPYKELCGAGITLKIAFALGCDSVILQECLVMAAIATIGDVVDITDENRIIVKNGLGLINKGQCVKGLKALIKNTNLSEKQINSYHIGFIIGPCINAGGRLETAKKGIELFLSEDEKECDRLSFEIIALNEERKQLTEEMTRIAVDEVEEGEAGDTVLVIYLPECHESVAGIVAGRIKEQYYRPTLVITDSEGKAKGSARSVSGYDMFEELSKCKELFTGFGGHSMAAGFSLPKENIEPLRDFLNENEEADYYLREVWIDVPMPVTYLREDLIEEFSILEPFGKANPKPVFADKDLLILDKKIFGKNNNVVKLRLKSKSGKITDAVYFLKNIDDYFEPEPGDTISVVYYPAINEYMGRKTIQIIISDYRMLQA